MTGLADGFLEYATPSDEEYDAVLRHGMVVVDTNVLLNLYRYHPATREDLFRIVEAVGQRLFVPHRVASEFWANREATIRAADQETSQLRESLEGQKSRSLQAIGTWAERVALPAGTKEDLAKALDSAYEDLAGRIDAFNGESLSLSALNTIEDPILQRLVPLLEARVGPRPTPTEREAASKEAERRIVAEEPPGFADAAKRGDARHGDYVLWKEVVTEAAARQVDVLLVTGDVKEDWWRKEKGLTRGPRLELIRELFEVAGARLFMLRPASLLLRAMDALRLPITDESVRAAETVDRLLIERRLGRRGEDGRFSLEKLPDGRSGDYLDTLIEMTSLAEPSPPVDEYIDAFQARFPSITLKDVARRRIKVLESLGLADLRHGQVVLTELGQRLLDERALELVQDSFMDRIAGALEIRDLASSTPLARLRSELRDDPPEGLSSTQAQLVLRWMEQLDLI